MKFPMSAVLIGLTIPLGTQAAPSAPEVGMRAIASYATLDCPQIKEETQAVAQWKQYFAARSKYLQEQTNTMQKLDAVGSVLSDALGKIDPSNQDIRAGSIRQGALATESSQVSQEQAAMHEAGLKKRADTLRQLHDIRKCMQDTAVSPPKKELSPNIQMGLAAITRLKMEDPNNPVIPRLLYKVAMALYYGDDENEGRRMLIELIENYPSSPSASEAKVALKSPPPH